MSRFNDGAAEARVADRYADVTPQDIQQTQHEHNAELQAREVARLSTEVRESAAIATGRMPVRATVTNIRAASEKAIDYLVSLSLSRRPDVSETVVREWARSSDRAIVSSKIDELKALRPVAVTTAPAARTRYDVPAGRYAVTGEDGQTVFVKVDRPTEGTFVKVQAGDDLHRVSNATRDALLAKITNDGPKEASTRYGREIGDCGRCGRTLTDEASRAAGIGPICAAKGW